MGQLPAEQKKYEIAETVLTEHEDDDDMTYDAKTEDEPFEVIDTNEEHEHIKPAEKKNKKLFVLGIIAICVLSLLFGVYMRTETTVFMEHKTSEGYLPAEEFVLSRQDTGKPAQDIRSLAFRDMDSTANNNNGYVTSRGIGPGSTWQEFLEAYGDIETKDIQIVNENAQKDETNLIKGLTVREFDEKYVKTGEVVPGKDTIGIRFSFFTDGKKICYNDKELEQYYEEYVKKGIARKDPVLNEFVLTVVFEPVFDEKDTVYWISSYRENRPLAEKIY